MNNVISEKEVLDVVYNSGLHQLLLDCMAKSYKYESLKCNLEGGCTITFEINTQFKQDDN